jgi:small subunit ribosomal protein S6
LAAALRDYELVVILNPEISDDLIDGSIERLNQSIRTGGGEVVDINHWGRRRLAYPIKHHMDGNYVVSQVKLDPTQISTLESGLRISEEVLRHLIIKSGE